MILYCYYILDIHFKLGNAMTWIQIEFEQRQFMYFAMSGFQPSDTEVSWIHPKTKEMMHGNAWTSRKITKYCSKLMQMGTKNDFFFLTKMRSSMLRLWSHSAVIYAVIYAVIWAPAWAYVPVLFHYQQKSNIPVLFVKEKLDWMDMTKYFSYTKYMFQH